MQKAREALEILHSQDMDGLSGSAQVHEDKSEAGSGVVDSISSSAGGESLAGKKSLTSQHLLPRIKVTKDEREEEKRVTAIDESRGIYRELTVTYGNRLEVLGLLLVEEGTSFPMAHTMVKSMVKKYYQPTIDKIEEQVLAVHEKYKAYDLDAEDISLIEDDGGSSVNSSSTKGSISTVNSQKYESATERFARRERRHSGEGQVEGERDELQDLKKQMMMLHI